MSVQLLDAMGSAFPTRIVLVEDSPTQSAVIQGILQRAGWEVMSFVNGYECLSYVREAPVDLILLDLFLPDLDGYEICQKLRMEERTRAIPIIILSAQQDKADKVKALEAGADDFLSKPVDDAELLARVRAHMRARRLFEQASLSAVRLADANQELEKASRLKSEFLANMSHELRTPLNAIIGFSEVLLDPEIREMADEKRTQFLENIHRSGRHLLDVINDILDLSKVEAGRMELRREMLQVRELVLGCIAIVAPLADKKGITLDADSVAADLSIPADPARVKQILYNLLSNAVKFTAEGGKVNIAAQRQESSRAENERPGTGGLARHQNVLEISVTDTGIGIEPKDQALVFDEFRQVDQGVARQQEGTGLGLALVRRLVELHGGEVWVESTPGTGSCFAFTLPFAWDAGESSKAPLSPRESAERPSVESREPKGLSVLVIEDEEEAAQLLALHLTRAGYDVYYASTADTALETARRVQPFVVTLDVLLSGRHGWEILAALKSDPDTQDIDVVVVSVVDNRELGFALGATDYLVKPVDPGVLCSILQRLEPQRTESSQSFMRDVMRAARRGRSFSVVVVHVLGQHQQGAERSETTAELCRRFSECLRTDDLVAHDDVGEILLLLPKTGPDNVQPVLNKLQTVGDAVTGATYPERQGLAMTFASFPADAVTAEQLLRVARQHLETSSPDGGESAAIPAIP